MARTETSAPTRKVVAATGGAFTGQYVGEILVYIIEQLSNAPLPERIETAIIGLVSAALAFGLAYWIPPAPDEGVR